MTCVRLLCLLFFLIFDPAGLAGQSNDAEENPSISVFDTPVSFSGSERESQFPLPVDEVRIGFFAPGDQTSPVGAAMLNAAQLAITEANDAGGWHGLPFRLVQRWSDKPWEGAAKEIIKLVYEDSVWAIVGGLDGETTHIAEQIATKAWVPLISPVSADPTLTYIRLPWIFRLPPDTEEQVNMIVDGGIKAMALARVGLITSVDHDGRIFADEVRQSLAAAKLAPSFHFQLAPHFDVDDIVEGIDSFRPDGIVISLPHDELIGLLNALRESNISLPIFLPWIPEIGSEILVGAYSKDIFYVEPFSTSWNPAYSGFAEKYLERYGCHASASAAYTYDAVNIVTMSLRRSGLNRGSLRAAIFAIENFHGVTGPVSWDNGGGNEVKIGRYNGRLEKGEGSKKEQ